MKCILSPFKTHPFAVRSASLVPAAQGPVGGPWWLLSLSLDCRSQIREQLLFWGQAGPGDILVLCGHFHNQGVTVLTSQVPRSQGLDAPSLTEKLGCQWVFVRICVQRGVLSPGTVSVLGRAEPRPGPSPIPPSCSPCTRECYFPSTDEG
jgi:hypothetical protein